MVRPPAPAVRTSVAGPGPPRTTTVNKVIPKNLKKFFIKICIILVCLYSILLLNSMVKPEVTVDVALLNASLPQTTQVHLEENMKLGFIQELQRRRTTIQNVCAQQPKQTKFLLRSIYKKVIFKLYIDTRHKLAWCPTFKAASSTIMRLYATMGGILTKENELREQKGQIQIVRLTRKVFPQLLGKDAHKLVQRSNRLLVVRHPFARLLSAYRDKLECRENREFYYEKYGKHIVRLFGDPSKQEEPTFVEFLKALKISFLTDEHWRPYYKECAPCLLNYNIILKTESLDTELEELLTSFHLTQYLTNKTFNKNPQGTTDWQMAEKYYSQVPLTLLRAVYQKYQMDFELFNYSPEPYFKMAKS